MTAECRWHLPRGRVDAACENSTSSISGTVEIRRSKTRPPTEDSMIATAHSRVKARNAQICQSINHAYERIQVAPTTLNPP
jgi:hypothetical protein